MNAAEANLLREFIEEARLRGRRTKSPEEQQAAKSLEQKFLTLLKKEKATLVGTAHAKTYRHT